MPFDGHKVGNHHSVARIVGIRAVFQHRVAGVAVGFFRGSAAARSEMKKTGESDRVGAALSILLTGFIIIQSTAQDLPNKE